MSTATEYDYGEEGKESAWTADSPTSQHFLRNEGKASTAPDVKPAEQSLIVKGARRSRVSSEASAAVPGPKGGFLMLLIFSGGVCVSTTNFEEIFGRSITQRNARELHESERMFAVRAPGSRANERSEWEPKRASVAKESGSQARDAP